MQKKDYRNELRELSRLKKVVQASLKKAPEGRIRCEMAQGRYPQYYIILEEEREQYPRGRFLHKEEQETAKTYAQKEYDRLMLKEIERREKVIRFLARHGDEVDYLGVYEGMAQAKRRLVEPYFTPDEEFRREWENAESEQRNSYPFINGFTTERGELVRSKSEKIIADKLFLKDIPYKYEAALQLGSRVIFPDFTILRMNTREEVYLEHFGMMDDPEYCKKALDKIEEYEGAGICLGEKLFVTFESSEKPININQVNNLINRITENGVTK